MLKQGKIAAMAEPAEFQRTTDPEIREFITVGGTVPPAMAVSAD
jgi:phospholipid/cholesterol/gamma-HCH transport system ATP-binding protein